MVFVWTTASWMLLPWHQTYLREFRDPDAVARVLRENAPVRGVYTLNDTATGADGLLKPSVYAAIAPRPSPMTAATLLLQAFANVGAALLVAFVLCGMQSASYWKLVTSSTLTGLAFALLTALPNFIWWQFPRSYLVVAVVEPVVGWFAAGMVMAKFCVRDAE